MNWMHVQDIQTQWDKACIHCGKRALKKEDNADFPYFSCIHPFLLLVGEGGTKTLACEMEVNSLSGITSRTTSKYSALDVYMRNLVLSFWHGEMTHDMGQSRSYKS